jgi:hypothetical protein
MQPIIHGQPVEGVNVDLKVGQACAAKQAEHAHKAQPKAP